MKTCHLPNTTDRRNRLTRQWILTWDPPIPCPHPRLPHVCLLLSLSIQGCKRTSQVASLWCRGLCWLLLLVNAVYFNRGPWNRAAVVILEAPPKHAQMNRRTDFVGYTLYWKRSSVGSLAPSRLVSSSVLEVNYFFVPVFMFPGSRLGERIQQGKDNCVVAALCTQSQDCLLQAVNIIIIIKQSAHRNIFLLQIFPSNQY